MDWNSLGADAVKALIPIVSLIVAYLVKLVKPSIPPIVLPILAAALPFVVTLIGNYVTGHPALSPLIAALLGGAAVWIQNIITQLNTVGFSSRPGRKFKL